MSFTAEFVGGPLDGVRSLVRNPALAADTFYGYRCLATCRLTKLVPAEARPDALRECETQRCHLFMDDPAGYGLTGARRYRRAGVRENVHRYEIDDASGRRGGGRTSTRKRVPAAIG